MYVKWIGIGKIDSRILDTNYLVSVPGRYEKYQMYHVNLLKSCMKRIGKVNILTNEVLDTIKSPDLEIYFQSVDSSSYNFEEIVKEANLKNRFYSNQLHELEILLNEYQEVFSNDTGLTDLTKHEIELSENQTVSYIH